jgi:hypothetical protein
VEAGKRRFLALAFVAVLVLPVIVSQNAFADGLTQENIQGNIAGRDVNLFVKVNPPILTTQTQEDAYVQVRLFEGNNETIKYTTFIIEVSKVTGSGEDVLMFPEAFHTESGLLTLKIEPQEGETRVLATKEGVLDAYKADPGGTINIRGPLLLEGGLYHFTIDLIGVDSIKELLPADQVKTFDTYLSVGDVVTQDVQYQGETYPLTIISYYDKVQDFAFDQDAATFSWSMPFNWDIERIKSAQNMFVHEEIKVPKSLQGVGDVNAFEATVNDKPIIGRMLAVDPFSSETELILHFLINKNDIIAMADQVPDGASEMTFSFAPASDGGDQTSGEISTDTGGIHVKLNWDPSQMGASTEETLNLEFIDAFSGDKMESDVTYDLRIIDDAGGEVLALTDQVAEGGSDSQQITFPADENYRIEVEVKAIAAGQTPDLTRNGIARGIVVVPEFPAGAMLAIAGLLGGAVAASRLIQRK